MHAVETDSFEVRIDTSIVRLRHALAGTTDADAEGGQRNQLICLHRLFARRNEPAANINPLASPVRSNSTDLSMRTGGRVRRARYEVDPVGPLPLHARPLLF